MPGSSTIRQFITDIHDRESNTTRALDQLFGTNPAQHSDAAADSDVGIAVDWLNNPVPPKYPSDFKLSDEAKKILEGKGLSPAELAHIDAWPKGQRKKVLDKLAAAVGTTGNPGSDTPYKFLWELTSGDDEETDDSMPGTVVFRSPREKVSVGSVVTFGAVNVDV